MTTNDITSYIATATREECRELQTAIRARFKALRDADPHVYLIERTITSDGRSWTQYETMLNGQRCFLRIGPPKPAEILEEVKHHADFEADPVKVGTGDRSQFATLSISTTESAAQFMLDWWQEEDKKRADNYRIRRADKITGELIQ
jgi:hypothetical protein